MGHATDLAGARGKYDLASRAPGGVLDHAGDVSTVVDLRQLLGENHLRSRKTHRVEVEIRVGHLDQIDLVCMAGVHAVSVELHHGG